MREATPWFSCIKNEPLHYEGEANRPLACRREKCAEGDTWALSLPGALSVTCRILLSCLSRTVWGLQEEEAQFILQRKTLQSRNGPLVVNPLSGGTCSLATSDYLATEGTSRGSCSSLAPTGSLMNRGWVCVCVCVYKAPLCFGHGRPVKSMFLSSVPHLVFHLFSSLV